MPQPPFPPHLRMPGAALFCVVSGLLLAVATGPAMAAPEADLWRRWLAHQPDAQTSIDHSAWSAFLANNLVTDDPSGVNLLPYGQVSPADRARLQDYLAHLQAIPISAYNRAEQKAYWINLYNALTVETVLAHYPVDSIRDIDISSGWFNDGPWDAELATVEGKALTLNDIEHRILRPIWKDNRIHYAVNCASMGCPNLAPTAYTAANSERLLEAGARAYVNHPRGARFKDGKLFVSSIYHWYEADFGGTGQGVVQHLLEYSEPELATKLRAFEFGRLRHDYDWSLNEP